jgi:hypothetical protein
MSLLDDVIKQVLGGASKHLHFGNWDGSFDGHPHSVTVDNTKSTVKLEGTDIALHFEFSVPTGFVPAGSHVLEGVLGLPDKTKSITFDGASKTGHIIVVGHTKGGHPRAEVLFKFPEPGDPNNHYRFDADFTVS